MLECKLDEYHIYQTIAEMIKSAGDMVVKSLVDGHLERRTDIYGLAIDYDTKSAKLVELNINFEITQVQLLNLKSQQHII